MIYVGCLTGGLWWYGWRDGGGIRDIVINAVCFVNLTMLHGEKELIS